MLELNAARKKPEWLGKLVGFKKPSSIRQIINGHHGPSREVYDKICEVFPELQRIFAPPMMKVAQGPGAYGPHKDHDYPAGSPFHIVNDPDE